MKFILGERSDIRARACEKAQGITVLQIFWISKPNKSVKSKKDKRYDSKVR